MRRAHALRWLCASISVPSLGRPSLWGWSHSVCLSLVGGMSCKALWTVVRARCRRESAVCGLNPNCLWICDLRGASATLRLRVPFGVVSLCLGGPKSMACGVFRSRGMRGKSWYGQERRGHLRATPRPLGPGDHPHTSRRGRCSGDLNCKIPGQLQGDSLLVGCQEGIKGGAEQCLQEGSAGRSIQGGQGLGILFRAPPP